jgi:subtilisin-like proprotein convertase family protein
MWGTITKMTVTLSNVWHTWPADIDILLVGPTGTNVVLMADAGYHVGLSGVTLTFDDSAATNLSDTNAIIAGTYRPTSYETIGNTWTAPAPGSPWGTKLAGLNGADPNGVWKLFVYDDAAGDQGAISNGWLIAFTTTGPVAPIIQQSLISAGQFQFKFQTVTNHTYFVEYKTNLADALWSPLQTLPGDGTLKSISDPATSRQRFYRIRLQ